MHFGLVKKSDRSLIIIANLFSDYQKGSIERKTKTKTPHHRHPKIPQYYCQIRDDSSKRIVYLVKISVAAGRAA